MGPASCDGERSLIPKNRFEVLDDASYDVFLLVRYLDVIDMPDNCKLAAINFHIGDATFIWVYNKTPLLELGR